jgi:flagellar biosynthesis protein FliQ
MAATGATRQDLAMKIIAASATWFLGAWVLYDMAAFATGMSRQITPLVALTVALVVGLALHLVRANRTTVEMRSPITEPLRKAA